MVLCDQTVTLGRYARSGPTENEDKMTENTLRVSPPRLPFWARFAIVVLAIAGACLGLVTLHSATSHQVTHSHDGVNGAHGHSDIASSAAATTDSAESNGTGGFLATCEGCALGTVAGATGAAALLLLLLAVTFVLRQSPAVFDCLLDRGRVLMAAVADFHRSLTPPPFALGISRT